MTSHLPKTFPREGNPNSSKWQPGPPFLHHTRLPPRPPFLPSEGTRASQMYPVASGFLWDICSHPSLQGNKAPLLLCYSLYILWKGVYWTTSNTLLRLFAFSSISTFWSFKHLDTRDGVIHRVSTKQTFEELVNSGHQENPVKIGQQSQYFQITDVKAKLRLLFHLLIDFFSGLQGLQEEEPSLTFITHPQAAHCSLVNGLVFMEMASRIGACLQKSRSCSLNLQPK